MLAPPTSGEVLFNGERISKKNLDYIRRKMGMVFQNFGLFSHMNVLDNVMFGQIHLLNKPKSEAKQNALSLLKTVGLLEITHYFPRQLSGGQKQRAAIARCLSVNPEVILFDEPTSALDPAMAGEVMAVMRTLAGSGMTMLIVTNEMNFAREIANRAFYMDEQGIYEEGTALRIFENPEKPKTRDFIFKIRSYSYSIKSRNFDFVEMLTGIDNFCFRHAIDKKLCTLICRLSEELVINITAPQYGACDLRISFSGELDSIEVAVRYKGENSNALDTSGDTLSVMLVRKSAASITHSYDNGINTITARCYRAA